MAVLVSSISVLYRFGPDAPDAKWRWISPGSLLSGIGILLLSLGFSFYAEKFGNYNETYGSLGAVIAFMVRVWLSVTFVLIGAELNAELDRNLG